jgi:hypothetical protein
MPNLVAQAPIITKIENKLGSFSGDRCLMAGAAVETTIYGQNFTPYPLVLNNNIVQTQVTFVSQQQIVFFTSSNLATGFLEVRTSAGAAKFCTFSGIDDPVSSKQESDAVSMDIYPNPSNNTAQVRYYLAQAGFVSVKIFDAQGKFLQTDVEELQQAGVHNLQLNLKTLPSGTYTLVTEINRIRTTKPFVIVR